MESPTLAALIAQAEQCSPERHPAQAVDVNQRILQLDPTNTAASVRLARAYQAQRQFAAAVKACQDALQRNPQSTVAQKHLRSTQLTLVVKSVLYSLASGMKRRMGLLPA